MQASVCQGEECSLVRVGRKRCTAGLTSGYGRTEWSVTWVWELPVLVFPQKGVWSGDQCEKERRHAGDLLRVNVVPHPRHFSEGKYHCCAFYSLELAVHGTALCWQEDWCYQRRQNSKKQPCAPCTQVLGCPESLGFLFSSSALIRRGNLGNL